MPDPEKFQFILETLTKAGWITDAHLFSKGDSRMKFTLKPTTEGGERFRAILFLMRELQPFLGRFTYDEMGYVCECATLFAPDKESLTWPSELPPVGPGHRR